MGGRWRIHSLWPGQGLGCEKFFQNFRVDNGQRTVVRLLVLAHLAGVAQIAKGSDEVKETEPQMNADGKGSNEATE